MYITDKISNIPHQQAKKASLEGWIWLSFYKKHFKCYVKRPWLSIIKNYILGVQLRRPTVAKRSKASLLYRGWGWGFESWRLCLSFSELSLSSLLSPLSSLISEGMHDARCTMTMTMTMTQERRIEGEKPAFKYI